MLPTCASVLKGVCGKVNCRNETGQRACIILAACNLQTFKVSKVYSCGNNVDDSLNYSSGSSVASDMVDNIDLAKLPVTVNSDKVFKVGFVVEYYELVCWSLHSWKKVFAICWVVHQNISA